MDFARLHGMGDGTFSHLTPADGENVLPLADGYWCVLNATVPTVAGAIAAAALHDGAEGDTSTGIANLAGNAKLFVIVAKAAGMTVDQLKASPGYTNLLNVVWYGSNDGVAWTVITTDTPMFSAHLMFSYSAYSFSCDPVTYKMIGLMVTDSGGAPETLQAGDADVRVKLAAVDVGP